MTQLQELRLYLRQWRSITQLRATGSLGILRLSERIRELEARGWVFTRHWTYPKNANKFYTYTVQKIGK
jgi:hypothetical protein